MPSVVLSKTGDKVLPSGAHSLVNKTHKPTIPNSLVNSDTKGRKHRGLWEPKEAKLTMPGVKEGFLEEVVIKLGTSKTQPKVWAGGPVEE